MIRKIKFSRAYACYRCGRAVSRRSALAGMPSVEGQALCRGNGCAEAIEEELRQYTARLRTRAGM